jgi:hypothetical protein
VIPREQMVEQSVMDFARDALRARYTVDEVEIVDSYDDHVNENGLDKPCIVAVGFNFDDGGKQAEVGSSLREMEHTVEFFVFGQTSTWAQNVARSLQALLWGDQGTLPLLDYEQAGKPEIDKLVVGDDPGPRAQREVIPEPEPWQEHTWTCRVRVIDTYDVALT